MLPELVEYEYEERKLYSFVENNQEYQPVIGGNQVHLLGKFDPLFVSYKEKDWIVLKVEEKEIWRSVARVEAIVIVGMKVVAIWRHETKGKAAHFIIYPMLKTKLTGKTKKELTIKFNQLAKFWEKEFGKIRYAELNQLK